MEHLLFDPILSFNLLVCSASPGPGCFPSEQNKHLGEETIKNMSQNFSGKKLALMIHVSLVEHWYRQCEGSYCLRWSHFIGQLGGWVKVYSDF